MTFLSFSFPQLTVIVGLLLIGSELLLGIDAGFDLVLIGSAIALGGGVGMLTNSVTVTLVVSIALILFYILYGRRAIKRRLILATSETNIDKLIGATGVVTQHISPDKSGRIKVRDEEWRAESIEELAPGEKASVVSVEGVTLNVIKKH